MADFFFLLRWTVVMYSDMITTVWDGSKQTSAWFAGCFFGVIAEGDPGNQGGYSLVSLLASLLVAVVADLLVSLIAAVKAHTAVIQAQKIAKEIKAQNGILTDHQIEERIQQALLRIYHAGGRVPPKDDTQPHT